jgi:MFS family permease
MSDLPMDSSDPTASHEFLARAIVTTRVIIIAMMVGICLFAFIVFILGLQANAPAGAAAQNAPAANGIPAVLALPFIAPVLVAAYFVPGLVRKKARASLINGSWKERMETFQRSGRPAPSNETEFLISSFQTATIIQLAICEGIAFFSLVIAMITRQPWLGLVAVIMVVVIATRFPSQSRLNDWLDRERLLMSEEKQFGSGIE